jgi:hypothetical protein
MHAAPWQYSAWLLLLFSCTQLRLALHAAADSSCFSSNWHFIQF